MERVLSRWDILKTGTSADSTERFIYVCHDCLEKYGQIRDDQATPQGVAFSCVPGMNGSWEVKVLYPFLRQAQDRL